jgi:hypothetical protein
LLLLVAKIPRTESYIELHNYIAVATFDAIIVHVPIPPGEVWILKHYYKYSKLQGSGMGHNRPERGATQVTWKVGWGHKSLTTIKYTPENEYREVHCSEFRPSCLC